uniref:Reverse transcriptase Ty1/copia-type domain-containing protein n=1 Tax=Solanum lycopersicum TaxID=4081 RepID=A0A3Q7GQU9_SOLLC
MEELVGTGSSMREINNLKTRLSSAFEMKDLGPTKHILGMTISQDRSAGTLNLSQELYIKKVLSRFRVNDAKPRTTPLSPKTSEECDNMALVPYASAVDSLMYVMDCTRPHIAHAMRVISRYMANPGKEHWEAVKWLLRYLRGHPVLHFVLAKSMWLYRVYLEKSSSPKSALLDPNLSCLTLQTTLSSDC